jgi:hypothetical protein
LDGRRNGRGRGRGRPNLDALIEIVVDARPMRMAMVVSGIGRAHKDCNLASSSADHGVLISALGMSATRNRSYSECTDCSCGSAG